MAPTPEPATGSGIYTKKVDALTLSQLASYDDLCTDALVDRVSSFLFRFRGNSPPRKCRNSTSHSLTNSQVYFWTNIRKNRSRYFPCRGLHEEEIAGILRQYVVIDKDPATATAKLLELSGIKKYHDRLPTTSAKEHFARHVRKYVDIYLPDCPWECATTNRYTIDTHEAATYARRPIKKGELVKYLSGIQAPITKQEEQDLDLTRRDFSIVMSSRKKVPSLFLGPARFANHDCDANARLTTRGFNGMTVVAARDIKVGEEVTVSYGDNYFGEDNCECLCATCERLQRNGWDPDATTNSDEEDEDEGNAAEKTSGSPRSNASGSAVSETRAATDSASSSRNATPQPQQGQSKKRKIGEITNGAEGVENIPKHPRLNDLKKRPLPMSKLSQEFHFDNNDASAEASEVETPRSSSPASPASALEIVSSSQPSHQSTTSTSIADSACMIQDGKLPTEIAMKDGTTVELPDDALQLLNEQAGDTITIPVTVVEQAGTSDDVNMHEANQVQQEAASEDVEGNSSELSDLGDDLVIDDKKHAVVKRKHDSQPRVTRRALAQLTKKEGKAVIALNIDRSASHDRSSNDPNARRPGDYTLTPRLLVTPHSRWVKCRVCNDPFVQSDAFQTRLACPRCERHSKLYGYQWPKTDKSGKHDSEERILDHRTIHRFVDTEEERLIRKGRRSGLQGLIADFIEETERDSDSEPDDSAVGVETTPKRGRKRQRQSESEEVQVVPQLDGAQESAATAVVVKRKPGRPRKHPLPETPTREDAVIQIATALLESAKEAKKEKDRKKALAKAGPQPEAWHDKHGKFGGRWLYLTEKPKALYDDDNPPVVEHGKRRAAQVAAEKLPEHSNRRHTLPAKLEPKEKVTTKPAKSSERKSVVDLSETTLIVKRKVGRPRKRPLSPEPEVKAKRPKGVTVEIVDDEEVGSPVATRKYVRSGMYTKAAKQARLAQKQSEESLDVEMEDEGVENDDVQEVNDDEEDNGEDEEDEPEEEEEAPAKRKYVKSGNYTKTAKERRKSQTMARRRSSGFEIKQEPDENRPGKLKKPTRRVTMG